MHLIIKRALLLVRSHFEAKHKKTPLELANAINDINVDFVVVHGRTRADGYKKERIDYDSIALIKKHIKIPLIANGEITSAQVARIVLEKTGANGLMIGRAAIKSTLGVLAD